MSIRGAENRVLVEWLILRGSLNLSTASFLETTGSSCPQSEPDSPGEDQLMLLIGPAPGGNEKLRTTMRSLRVLLRAGATGFRRFYVQSSAGSASQGMVA